MAAEQTPRLKEGFLETSGFGRVHYVEGGEGIPLVLLHTNGGSAYQYVGAMKSLCSRFRVIAWDMPGHGDSDPLSRHFSIEDYGAALAAFMDALGITAAHIAGCSCGGTISVGFASRYPLRTLTATIVETPFRTEEEWEAYWGNIQENFGLPTQSLEQVKSRLNDVDNRVFASWNVDRNKAGARQMVGVMWAMRQFDIGANLANLRCPTLLLYGAKGPAIATKDRFATARPGIRTEIFENVGHFPMLDAPVKFAATLASFCR